MKNSAILLVLLLLSITSFAFAQTENHKWKTLMTGRRNVWYDLSQLDTIKSQQFDIWTIELHKPPITIDGVEEKVTRSKTLYSIDRSVEKYGLKKVVYYNNVNAEIARYAYDSDESMSATKYYFPTLNNTIIEAIFSELNKKTGK